jgi:hypothetical protein
MHTDPHPMAGVTVTATTAASPVRPQQIAKVVIEDWWDRLTGESWMLEHTPIAVDYGLRRRATQLPVDDEVLYVKTQSGHGHLVHTCEITEPAP